MLYGDFDSIELVKGRAALYRCLVFWKERAAASPDGRHELEHGAYAQIKAFTPQPRDQRRFECHDRFVDVQCVLEGEELIYVRPRAGLQVQEDVLAQRDAVFYHQPADATPEIPFLMRPGAFLLLCPEDAHKPECLASIPAGRKLVIKIPVAIL